MRTCRVNLQTYCKLPDNWSMSQAGNDVQVGMYLGCLYQNRQQVLKYCDIFSLKLCLL